MPVTKPASSKSKSASSVPSFYQASLKEFGGGRWEGGIGTVVDGVYGPWKFPGSESKKCTLFGLLTIRDETGEDHVIPYQAGFFGETDPRNPNFFNNAYPSRNGATPAGPNDMDMEELLEIYAKLAAGEVELSEEEEPDYRGIKIVFRRDPENPDAIRKLPKKDCTQLIQTVEGLEEFQAPDGTSTFPTTNDFDMFNGYRFEWAWMPQRYMSKKMREKGSTFEVLVPIRSFGRDEEWEGEQEEEVETPKPAASTKTGKGKAMAKPVSVEEEEEVEEVDENEETEEVEGEEGEEDEVDEEAEEDELGERVDTAIRGVLKKLGRAIPKGRELNPPVLAKFEKGEHLTILNSYLNNNSWMTSKERTFKYKDGKFYV